MGPKTGVAGVEALVLVLHALALVLEVPAIRGLGGRRRIANAVAIVDGNRRPALVAENLALVVAPSCLLDEGRAMPMLFWLPLIFASVLLEMNGFPPALRPQNWIAFG